MNRIAVDGLGEVNAEIDAFRWQHHKTNADTVARDRFVFTNAKAVEPDRMIRQRKKIAALSALSSLLFDWST